MKPFKSSRMIQIKIHLIALCIGGIAVILLKLPESWGFYVLLITAILALSRIIYFIFFGINIKKLQFINSEQSKFKMKFRLGMSSMYKIKGEILDDVHVSTQDLKQLISRNTTRMHLKDTLSYYGDNVTIRYKYRNELLQIRFYIK